MPAILLSLRWAGTFVPLPSPQIYLSLCRIPLHMELYKLHLYILFTLFSCYLPAAFSPLLPIVTIYYAFDTYSGVWSPL